MQLGLAINFESLIEYALISGTTNGISRISERISARETHILVSRDLPGMYRNAEELSMTYGPSPAAISLAY